MTKHIDEVKEELKAKLLAFEKAYKELNHVWMQCDDDELSDIPNALYPFAESFDDLYIKVIEWTGSSIYRIEQMGKG